jgi:hypothetical protein
MTRLPVCVARALPGSANKTRRASRVPSRAGWGLGAVRGEVQAQCEDAGCCFDDSQSVGCAYPLPCGTAPHTCPQGTCQANGACECARVCACDVMFVRVYVRVYAHGCACV